MKIQIPAMPQLPTTTVLFVFLVGASSAALYGCSSLSQSISVPQSIEPQPPTPQQQAEQLEPMLTAAGFRRLPADTPQRRQHLQSLVPLQVSYYLGRTGTLHYYMADPDYCKCTYIGSEEDYQQYEKMKSTQQFEAKEGERSQQKLEAQQMDDMDAQAEMFNPYGMGLAGPMGPSIYW